MKKFPPNLYSFAIVLPPKVQSALSLMFYGLPQVQWIEEESLHLTLRDFKGIEGPSVEKLRQRLNSIYFLPFSITLEGICLSQNRGNRGMIMAGVSNEPPISLLRKEIDRELRILNLPSYGPIFSPHVTLGIIKRENQQKLSDFLAAHAFFKSMPFQATSCVLLRTIQTPKRIVSEIIENYPASKQATGED